MTTIILTSNKQARSLVNGDALTTNNDIEIAFDGFNLRADIKCRHIYSKDYKRDIKALHIGAGKIEVAKLQALDIYTFGDVYANEVYAGDIKTESIRAKKICANNIYADYIEADDIDYYAVCFAYEDIHCRSIKGRRGNSRHFSLDGKVIIRGE